MGGGGWAGPNDCGGLSACEGICREAEGPSSGCICDLPEKRPRERQETALPPPASERGRGELSCRPHPPTAPRARLAMTLNKREKLGGLPQPHRGSLPLSADSHRRGSMPVPYKHQLLRGQAVDELEWPARARGASSIHSGSSDSIISSESAPGGVGDLGGLIKVILLGDSGVGKTALAEIFGGLEGSFPQNLGDSEDAYERKIVVDGEEATLMVYDVWEQTDSCGWMQENCLQMGNAYLIIFSVTDRGSFSKVTELLLRLRTARPNEDLPIILVGNKSDLVRSREVSLEEGRGVAVMLNCKYVETSAALHHNTRELFEGVVRQIRLRRRDRREKGSEQGGRRGGGPPARDSRRESITKRARRFLHGLVAKNSKFFKQRSKSCHDLSVL
ncbi:GTP-binding protein REM 2 isoform X2 [Rhinatrema bivittatum]|uniref:GTP-binding protein REM 2 isoform X2 n=1 Tax=Rhinatrema bivittatum TaxID=194408 RepID=UPI00112B58D6|nr:GTP-binding protein REM 2 isoform X2 [Rhinatrema bivittatum]